MNYRTLIALSKGLVLLTWLVGAAALLFPTSSTYGQLGRLLLAILLAVHVVECGVFFRSLQRTGRPLWREVAQTLLFGVIHYAEVKAEVKALGDATGGDGAGEA